MGLCGLEPQTLRLSGVRSNHLSYRPVARALEARGLKRQQACLSRVPMLLQGPGIAADPGLVIPRKEVIQPQVPLRLPCYDLVPVMEVSLGASPS